MAAARRPVSPRNTGCEKKCSVGFQPATVLLTQKELSRPACRRDAGATIFSHVHTEGTEISQRHEGSPCISLYSAVVRKNWKFVLTSYNAMCYMYFHGISYKSAGHRAGKRYPAVLLDLPRTPGAGPGITERRRDRLGGRGSQHAHSDACPADAEQTTEP